MCQGNHWSTNLHLFPLISHSLVLSKSSSPFKFFASDVQRPLQTTSFPVSFEIWVIEKIILGTLWEEERKKLRNKETRGKCVPRHRKEREIRVFHWFKNYLGSVQDTCEKHEAGWALSSGLPLWVVWKPQISENIGAPEMSISIAARVGWCLEGSPVLWQYTTLYWPYHHTNTTFIHSSA